MIHKDPYRINRRGDFDGKKEEKKKDKKKIKRRIFTVVFIVLIIGIGIGGYFYEDGLHYFTTDNAKVTADLRNVVPLTSGRIVKWNVSEGSYVEENEVIGRLQNGSYLRSPIKGQVVKSNVILNQMVSPSMVAAVIADTGNIHIGANVEETDITKIQEGQEAVVKLDAYPGQEFIGHVTKIDPVTQTALSGNAMSFTTSGTYTKVTQLIPIEIVVDDSVNLNELIGTNSTVKIKIR